MVTGASTGIGYTVALQLCKSGFDVFAGVRSVTDRDRLSAAGCTPVMLDVMKAEEISAAKEFIEKHGPLYGLVNNAGVAVAGPVEGVSLEQLRFQMDVNFFGVYEVTQKFLPLIRQSSGRIVNIGSIAGMVAPALFTPYSCSKFAIEAFSDGLRREMIEFGVKVSLVQPGSVKTPIWQKSRTLNEGLLEKISPQLQELYSKQIERLRQSVDHAEATAVECSKVSKVVLHALTSSSPRARYVVGKDARMAALFTKLLPDKILDRIVKVV